MTVSRRGALGLFGGALTLGFDLGCGSGAQTRIIRHADRTGELTANMYVSVKADGRVGLMLNKCEFGQGITAAYATLVAEELDVPVESIDFAFADSLPEYKTSYFMHLTGGSTSVKEGYLPLRRAAASAREMLVTAAAAGWGVPTTGCRTEGGHVICGERRVGYGALTTKAARVPVPEEPRLKPRGEFKLIGKRNLRVDARVKVTGQARFGIDVVIPGMLKALVIHGPVYGAQATHLQADEAKRMPGVVDVFPFRWGVAIVAEKYWQALAAAKTVAVTWDAGDVAALDTDELRAGAHAYRESGVSARDDGNVGKALAHASTKVDAVYDAPFLAHGTMEPQNCVVKIDGKRAEVWAPCQSPTVMQVYVAEALGISQNDVTVHTTFIGGGFGRRLYGDCAAQCALIARQVNRPVQLVWSRESDMTQAFYRPQTVAHVRGAIDDGGQVTALGIHIIAPPIALQGDLAMLRGVTSGVPHAVQSVIVDSLYGMFGSNTVPDLLATEGLRQSPYTVANFGVEFTPVHTKLPVCSWRSVANSINGFLVEGLIDELAHAKGQDPLAVRRKILPPASRARRVLDAVAQLAQWGKKTPGVGRGIARHESFGSDVAEVCDVEIVNGRIKVRRVWAVVDCGIVVNPDIVRAQIEGAILMGLSAALDQEITLKNGVVQETNYDRFPLLRMHECPEIVVQIMESDADPTGVGEPGLPPAAPAVANAIFDLTGVRLRRMPFQRAFNEARR